MEVPPVEYEQLSSNLKSESSAAIRERVNAARIIQLDRFKGANITSNARIPSGMLEESVPATDAASAMLKNVFDRLGLSARAYDRLPKVARTIADLDKSEIIDTAHLAESVQYRSLDRKYWRL